jgi:Ni,Fe-hydrogenase maturation factor
MAQVVIEEQDYSAIITRYYEEVTKEVMINKISSEVKKQVATVARQIAEEIMKSYQVRNLVVKELPTNYKGSKN